MNNLEKCKSAKFYADQIVNGSVKYVFDNVGKDSKEWLYVFRNNSDLDSEIMELVAKQDNNDLIREFVEFTKKVNAKDCCEYFTEQIRRKLEGYIKTYFTNYLLDLLQEQSNDLTPLHNFKKRMDTNEKNVCIRDLEKSFTNLISEIYTITWEDDHYWTGLEIMEKSLLNEPCRVFRIGLDYDIVVERASQL